MINRPFFTVALSVIALVAGGCGANENILKSGKETPAPTNTESQQAMFASDLESMRTADFRFIYVLRRKDGGKIDAEDRGVIKVNTTDANRRVGSDDDHAFIIGTNNPIPPAKFTALYARFAVEDYSPPREASNSNVNENK